MTTPDLNQGALAPVRDEADIRTPPVTGTLPRELNGMLIRNGPNPLNGRFQGNDVLSWWPEAAMLHGVAFENGRVSGYRNRWVRTRRWAEAHGDDEAGTLPDTNPNVNVVRHAGELLALSESSEPLAITTALETLGGSRHHAGGMTAHPKIDPVSGDMITFCARWDEPIRYRVIGPDGSTKCDATVAIDSPSMMHDMAITATHTILLDLNVAYDFSMLSQGYRLPLRWHESRRARLGVIPRLGGTVRWFEIAPCFIQHVVNAHDAGESTIVLDAVRYPWYLRLSSQNGQFDPNPLGMLWRYILDLNRGAVTEQQLCDVTLELPRINESRTGRSYRYLYAVEQPTDAEMRGLLRFDLALGTIGRYPVPEGDQNSEALFVPRPGATSEDDGWLLACIYRQAADSSDVVVLNARDLDGGPLATVHLPRRIPAGFHGAWIPT